MGDAIHICKNCHNQYIGSYCNVCGQKTTHRLDIKHILHEAVHVFTHTDKGIFSLIPKILFQSGKVALDYVSGKTKRHFNIFQYLLIVVGIVTLIISKTRFMEATLETMNTLSGAPISAKMSATQKEIIGFFQKYINLVLFAFIPVFALFSWLFFKSKRYNYAENVVLQVAIQGSN